jgi:hypothetical protein
MQPGQELVSRISAYNPDFDVKTVEIACEYAKKMHDGQTRASGEPYYTHPIEVATILADMKMDAAPSSPRSSMTRSKIPRPRTKTSRKNSARKWPIS